MIPSVKTLSFVKVITMSLPKVIKEKPDKVIVRPEDFTKGLFSRLFVK